MLGPEAEEALRREVRAWEDRDRDRRHGEYHATDFRLSGFQNSRVTGITVSFFHPDGREDHSDGHAVRSDKDKHDPEAAYYLALGRALETLGKRLQKRAWGRINTIDNDRRQKARGRQIRQRRERHRQILQNVERSRPSIDPHVDRANKNFLDYDPVSDRPHSPLRP